MTNVNARKQAVPADPARADIDHLRIEIGFHPFTFQFSHTVVNGSSHRLIADQGLLVQDGAEQVERNARFHH